MNAIIQEYIYITQGKGWLWLKKIANRYLELHYNIVSRHDNREYRD